MFVFKDQIAFKIKYKRLGSRGTEISFCFLTFSVCSESLCLVTKVNCFLNFGVESTCYCVSPHKAYLSVKW